MKKYIPLLKRTRLFSGIGEQDIEAMLSCLQARSFTYKKGEYVIRQGEHTDSVFILAEGKLHIQHDDYWGSRVIINIVCAGEMFGEAYASPESRASMNDVFAAEDSTVISFNVKRIMTVCSSACRFHSMAVQNLFSVLSEKNRQLIQKLGYISKRTTREKLMAYLSDEAERGNSSSFSIPFNRQQLADFLSVDRSAMSNELCRMRDDGLLKFEKNRFTLL
ncbi:MAG: Crp/Fnr family transcriptional regulator [Oscillospiraceae bacterium]|nr:Crp/Fnr family transcriptional regulator [Oscillospiraceae bacterium]